VSIYVSMNIIGGTSEDTIRQGVVRRKSRVCTAAVRSRKKKNGQTHARNGERERGREREENLCTTNPCNHHHHLPLGLGGRSLPGCVYCVRTAETARVRYVTRSSQVGIIHRQWSGPGANRGISLGRCPFDYYPPPPPLYVVGAETHPDRRLVLLSNRRGPLAHCPLLLHFHLISKASMYLHPWGMYLHTTYMGMQISARRCWL